MEEVLVRLDPQLPIAWESLVTLRIGYERAEVRVHDPSPSAQRFIAQLRIGVPETQLAEVAVRSGLGHGARRALLRQLAPAIRYEQTRSADLPQRPLQFHISGRGPLALALRKGLLSAGFDVTPSPHDAHFVLLIERYLRSADDAQRLLQERVPHLSLRLTDRSVCIGPLVPETGAPCLACVELHDRAFNPHADILAAQLCEERPAAETDDTCEFATSVTVAQLKQWLTGSPELRGVRLRYRVQAGVPSTIPTIESFDPHPECACASQRLPLAA